MLSSASWTRCLLTVGGLAHHVCAYLPQEGGSFVAGNLSVAAPYGIPPVEFGNVTANNLDSLATFNITGYNVSVDDTTAPAVAPGWTISVGVTDDVSLINAANSSKFDIEATTLFIEPPGGNITLDPSWRICAVVFPGLANATAPSTPIDGTCNRVLSSGCIQAIQSGSTLMDSNGNCGNYALPSSCMEFFPTLSVNNTATAFAINQTVLNAKRFYAYGSAATQTANTTAYAEARSNVWPVITAFGHLSRTDGTLSSSNTAIQCVRAMQGTTTPPTNPASGAGRSYAIPPSLLAATMPWLLSAGFILGVPSILTF